MTNAAAHQAASGSEPPVLELLYFDGCPNHTTFLPHLPALLARGNIDASVHWSRSIPARRPRNCASWVRRACASTARTSTPPPPTATITACNAASTALRSG